MFTRAQESRAESWSEGMGDTALDGSRDYDGSGKLDPNNIILDEPTNFA